LSGAPLRLEPCRLPPDCDGAASEGARLGLKAASEASSTEMSRLEDSLVVSFPAHDVSARFGGPGCPAAVQLRRPALRRAEVKPGRTSLW